MYKNDIKLKYRDIYINKTWRFLVPGIIDYGEIFRNFFNKFYKSAVCIGDCYFDDIIKEPSLFIIFDRRYKDKDFENFLRWVKVQDFYLENYQYNKFLHTVVIKYDENRYFNFIEGNYSKLYNNVQKYFVRNSLEYKIIEKQYLAKNNFKEEIKKQFNIIIEPEYQELSLPPEFRNEVLNCNSEYLYIKSDKDWVNNKKINYENE